MSYYKSRHYETDAKIGYIVTLDLSIKEWDSDRAVSCLFFFIIVHLHPTHVSSASALCPMSRQSTATPVYHTLSIYTPLRPPVPLRDGLVVSLQHFLLCSP